ncbi:MAG: UbiA family prenyltransferase [Verrucomicrobiota bacterium]
MLEYIKIARPDHWLKNIFILFGHVVALVLVPGLWNGLPTLGAAAFSLAPACLIASANYILNEILDAPFDRLHPTKKHRGVAAGLVSVRVLWLFMAGLILAGFCLALVFFNTGYTLALAMLLASGVVYNIPPVRMKDRAWGDVIAESFNNPIRLWLGWFALVPWPGPWPPLTVVLAWWSFGALLMTGKRYAEFRFIGGREKSGLYRKSLGSYSEGSLIIAMITYANLFCFCTGLAMAGHPALRNLVLVFPVIVLAIIAYFRHAMSEIGARLEPEQLLRNPWIIVWTMATAVLTLALLTTKLNLAAWVFP